MDPLVKAALVGTSQYNPDIAATSSGLDALTEQIPGVGGERKILLSAGARAIYQLAGYTPVTLAAPEAAPEETLPVCSPEISALVKLVLESGEDELQILLFKRLQQAGLRLAPELLPTALETRDQTKRNLLYPLLGQRGVWLSRHNPAWSWVAEIVSTLDGSLPPDAETLWQEGTPAQRLEVLRQLRAVDPRLARQWIETTWKHEKAELRTELLGVLAVKLEAEDEPLLERALDDKAATVRTAAAQTLRHLTTSTLAQRMWERAQGMLTYAKGALKVTLPSSLDTSWRRDGIAAKEIGQKSDRTAWFIQVLSAVPPAHWEEQFALSAEALIALASGTKWEAELLEGWTRGAVACGGDFWLVPLEMFWNQTAKSQDRRQRASEMYSLLGPLLPPSLQEETAIRLLRNPDSTTGPYFSEVISSVRQPWSTTLGEEYLRGLRAFVSGLTGKSTSMGPWDESLAIAATALPADVLAAACEPLVVPGDKHTWYAQQFQRQLDGFQNTMRLRARIEKEISL